VGNNANRDLTRTRDDPGMRGRRWGLETFAEPARLSELTIGVGHYEGKGCWVRGRKLPHTKHPPFLGASGARDKRPAGTTWRLSMAH